MDDATQPRGTADEFASAFLPLLTDDAPESAAPDAPEDAVTAAADPAAVESEESDADPDLTPEERVAAALADGADEDATAVAEPDEAPEPAVDAGADVLAGLSDEEIRQIARDGLANRESDRQKRAEAIEADTVRQAQADLDGLYQEYTGTLTRVRQHYFREEQRLLDQVWRDAQAAPNPDAYWQLHSPQTRAQVRQAEDAYIASNVTAPYQQRMQERQQTVPTEVGQALFRELKGEYVADLVDELGLNKAAIPELMKVADPDALLARAQELVTMRDAVLAARERDRIQQRKDAAREVATTAVRPPATGRPRAGAVKALKGDEAEGWALLRDDLTA